MDAPFKKNSKPRAQLRNQFDMARKYKKHLKDDEEEHTVAGRKLEYV
jgi:hypothetical protein